jgi:hypothetical protein
LARSTSYEAPHYAVSSNLPPLISLLGPNILLSTLFSNTLSLCSSLNVRDQVSHPYRTTGKIIVLYILIFMFLTANEKTKMFWTEWNRSPWRLLNIFSKFSPSFSSFVFSKKLI